MQYLYIHQYNVLETITLRPVDISSSVLTASSKHINLLFQFYNTFILFLFHPTCKQYI